MSARSNARVVSLVPAPALRRPKVLRDDVQSLSLVLARKVALACFPRHIGGVTFYDVPRGWVTAVLRDDPHIRVPETSFDLNDFFNNATAETILIPSDFPASRSVVERMCGFCGVAKTIFFEVDDE